METCPICGSPVGPADSVCQACGFKLSGATQQFSPIGLSQPIEPIAAAESKQATLSVVKGPQRGMVFNLGSIKKCTVGRNPKCDIFLNDTTVSRHHADIILVDSSHIIQDANSFNGVWVNNQNVTSHLLQNGDVIQIGTFCLLYSNMR